MEGGEEGRRRSSTVSIVARKEGRSKMTTWFVVDVTGALYLARMYFTPYF